MFTSLTPSWRSVVRSSFSHSPACSGERRSGSVTISASGVPPRLKSTIARVRAVDAPARADVDQLGRVLLEVHAVDAHLAQPPAAAQGLVVLGDLVALGQVGIEVVLAVEDRARRELGAEREADHQPEVHRAGVGDRQAAGQPEADGAGVRVGRLAERQLAAAEHLRGGRQLDVDLQADDRLEAPRRRRWRRALLRHAPALPSKPSACSSAWAASSRRFSLNAGPASCRPTGSPSLSPQGIEIAGMPASDIGTVQ